MLTTVEKMGSNWAIVVPEDFFGKKQFLNHEPVDVSWDSDKIVIREWRTECRKIAEERLREFYGDNYEEAIKHPEKFRIKQEEVDWGHPVGEEIW